MCGNTPAFQVQVVRNAGKSGGTASSTCVPGAAFLSARRQQHGPHHCMQSAHGVRRETVRRCSQAGRETYTALPLATPKVAGADSLAAAFGAIEADPFGF